MHCDMRRALIQSATLILTLAAPLALSAQIGLGLEAKSATTALAVRRLAQTAAQRVRRRYRAVPRLLHQAQSHSAWAASPPRHPADMAASTGDIHLPSGRDPFRSLLAAPGIGPGPMHAMIPGRAGLLWMDLAIEGVVTGGPQPLALVMGPDHRTYLLVPGVRIYDAVIFRINQRGIWFETLQKPGPSGRLSGHLVFKPLATKR